MHLLFACLSVLLAAPATASAADLSLALSSDAAVQYGTPRRISRGRFKATATVRLPRAWNGMFRYGSCFRYSGGSGMGEPDATCPERYRF